MRVELTLVLHGLFVEVASLDEPSRGVLESLRQDFDFFVEPASAEPRQKVAPRVEAASLRVELHGTAAPDALLPKTRPLFHTRMCAVHGFGPERACDYGRGTLAVASQKEGLRLIRVFSPSVDELYEVAYMALLSAIGEELDARRFHRVHALGLELRGSAGLVLLPQGGGKSAMAALLLRQSVDAPKVYSDEMPLIHGSMVHPMPVRMALRSEVARALGLSSDAPPDRIFRRRLFASKVLFPIGPGQVPEAKPVRFLLIGRKSEGQPRIEPTSKLRAFFELGKGMVVGLGLAQMVEFFVRLDALPRLMAIGISRFASAMRVVCAADCFLFVVSPDAKANVKVLKEFSEKI